MACLLVGHWERDVHRMTRQVAALRWKHDLLAVCHSTASWEGTEPFVHQSSCPKANRPYRHHKASLSPSQEESLPREGQSPFCQMAMQSWVREQRPSSHSCQHFRRHVLGSGSVDSSYLCCPSFGIVVLTCVHRGVLFAQLSSHSSTASVAAAFRCVDPFCGF